MYLYSLVDKKSGGAEYYIASCDEDAMRIASVMMISSRPLYEFAEDFFVMRVCELPQIRALIDIDIVIDCHELRRRIDAKRREQKDG